MSEEHTLEVEFTQEGALSRPLCVDLDGTLVTTDTLWESVVLLVRRRPWLAFATPFWLVGGRARFKRAVAGAVRLDPASLPYRGPLLDAIRASRALVVTPHALSTYDSLKKEDP